LGLSLKQSKPDLRLEDVKGLRVTEEVGHRDQELLEEQVGLLLPLLQIADVNRGILDIVNAILLSMRRNKVLFL